jgi:cytochrome c553
MPAWPAQERDDEVWAVVAFLLELPELDAAEYRALALGGEEPAAETAPIADLDLSPASRATLRESCTRCHGGLGLGRKGAAPSLAGQRPAYLRNALEAYARGERKSGIMRPLAASLDDGTIRELAEHYAGLPPAQPVRGDPGAIERGEAIAHRGIPSQSIPSCADCHGPGDTRRNAAYPGLAGQHADYLVLQLELFEHDRRGGSVFASLMRPIAARLTPEQMRDAAAYYASLSPEDPDASK